MNFHKSAHGGEGTPSAEKKCCRKKENIVREEAKIETACSRTGSARHESQKIKARRSAVLKPYENRSKVACPRYCPISWTSDLTPVLIRLQHGTSRTARA